MRIYIISHSSFIPSVDMPVACRVPVPVGKSNSSSLVAIVSLLLVPFRQFYLTIVLFLFSLILLLSAIKYLLQYCLLLHVMSVKIYRRDVERCSNSAAGFSFDFYTHIHLFSTKRSMLAGATFFLPPPLLFWSSVLPRPCSIDTYAASAYH